MKVEQACRLSADGTAKTREKIRTDDGTIFEVNLYARFNEVQGRYTVTQYVNRRKIETSRQFLDPHKIDRWRPSRKFATEDQKNKPIKTEYCLYLLASKENYRFKIGITRNIYTRIYQLRLIWGEFDLDTSCIIYGNEEHLQKLENILQFVFEEYRLDNSTLTEEWTRDWFDMDCLWYAKNEIRRLNSFRDEKIYRIFEGIDLNAFIVEDTDKLAGYNGND